MLCPQAENITSVLLINAKERFSAKAIIIPSKSPTSTGGNHETKHPRQTPHARKLFLLSWFMLRWITNWSNPINKPTQNVLTSIYSHQKSTLILFSHAIMLLKEITLMTNTDMKPQIQQSWHTFRADIIPRQTPTQGIPQLQCNFKKLTPFHFFDSVIKNHWINKYNWKHSIHISLSHLHLLPTVNNTNYFLHQLLIKLKLQINIICNMDINPGRKDKDRYWSYRNSIRKSIKSHLHQQLPLPVSRFSPQPLLVTLAGAIMVK